MKLVDTLAEQELLEILIEETKPQVPPECRHLHYLLFTPFRYGAPYPAGSRFRRAGLTPGVFYGSEDAATAIAEMAFHRLLFFAESPHTPWPQNAVEYTTFRVAFKTAAERLDAVAAMGFDVVYLPPIHPIGRSYRKGPNNTLEPTADADRNSWTAQTDYRACQDLADQARTAGIEALRYESARTAGTARGYNLALLTCRVFVSREPIERQTWRIHLGSHGVRALCEFPDARFGFDRHAFAGDPRIAAMYWQR